MLSAESGEKTVLFVFFLIEVLGIELRTSRVLSTHFMLSYTPTPKLWYF